MNNVAKQHSDPAQAIHAVEASDAEKASHFLLFECDDDRCAAVAHLARDQQMAARKATCSTPSQLLAAVDILKSSYPSTSLHLSQERDLHEVSATGSSRKYLTWMDNS